MKQTICDVDALASDFAELLLNFSPVSEEFVLFNFLCFFCARWFSIVKLTGPGVSLALCCFVVYSTRRFVLCLTLCYFVLVFFSPFSIAITSLGEERANLSAFRTFVRFVLVRFPLPLGVRVGLWFVIVALPGLFSYPFFYRIHDI